MYELALNARQCLCCGICADVCTPRALGLRPWRGRTVERRLLAAPALAAAPAVVAESFPFMAAGARCDGGLDCVNECPVSVLQLVIHEP